MQKTKEKKETDRRRYLKMLEQGIALLAIIVSIILVMFFLEDNIPGIQTMFITLVRLSLILILICGLAYIATTGIHEMRTG